MATILTGIPGLLSNSLINPAWKVWREDFAQIPEVTTYWTHTQTNGTLAVAAEGITQTLAGADNDLSQLYLTNATFALVASKKAVCEAKVKIDKGAAGTIGEQEIFVGLTAKLTGANFTVADGSGMTTDNCVGFWSPDGTAALGAIARKADVESIDLAALTYADVTDYVLSWYFDGASTTYYVDGVQTAKLYAFPTAVLTPCLYIKAGEAKPSVLTTGYIYVATER